MSTAKVNGKLLIDKDPNIIVAAEVELQAWLVTEVRMGFEAEVLVTASIALCTFRRIPTT